jgi:hypothetical protein
MAIKKITGNETPRPLRGKTHKSSRNVRFVDLNATADELVKYAEESFIQAPANPQDGDALVYNSTTGLWEPGNPASALPYKVYTALLTQTETDDPVATVLENTLGFDLVCTYSNVGQYVIAAPTPFDLSKTALDIQNSAYASRFHLPTITLYDGDETNIYIETLVFGTIDGNVLADNQLFNTKIEIRVYN